MTPKTIFTGETVNLKCVIETYSNWRYEWTKGSVMLQSSDCYTVNRDTLTIRGATESDQGQYWCRGQRDERPQSSQSSSVSLSVTGELNIIVLLYYMYDHTSNQKTFSFSDVTFTLLINIIIYTSFEGLIVNLLRNCSHRTCSCVHNRCNNKTGYRNLKMYFKFDL